MRMTTTLIPVYSFDLLSTNLIVTNLTPSLDSEISSDEDEELPIEETLTDRLLALKDIIPPTTRSYFSSTVSRTTHYIKSGLGLGGKALFVLSTSALLLGVPWALAFAEEQQLVDMEKEIRMREMGGEVLYSRTHST
jgi:mitochondrial import receptor subunit TOM22